MSPEGRKELRARIEELERELRDLRGKAGGRRPSRWVLWLGALALAAALAVAFLAGYVPWQRREAQIVREADERNVAAPEVRVAAVRRSPAVAQLQLPGTIQAITESPLLARADGYLKRRVADIGDRVAAGQLLAEIEAPELDQQARQAQAALEQARAALQQAEATQEKARSDEALARITAGRWANLLRRGVVSRQDNDQQQANWKAQTANLAAQQKSVAAAASNVAAAEANLGRIEDLRGYLRVRAPFAGLITQRNVDVGALVTSSNTLLFRVAQIGTLRTFINVPQLYASGVRTGMRATLHLTDRAADRHPGTVTRVANALDPATRTMLVEVQVPNPRGELLPGMYVQVSLEAVRKDAPLLLDADALEIRGDGILVAVVGRDRRVRFRKVTLGRDYGPEVEILSGLSEGDQVVLNPNDAIRDGVEVRLAK